MTAPQMTPSGYAIVGFCVVGAIVWLAKWWITKSLDARFAAKKREDDDFRREQIEDTFRQLKGQQVMTNGLLVVLRHEIYGNHVEDLEKAQGELKAFQNENEAAILKKAAKYNLR